MAECPFIEREGHPGYYKPFSLPGSTYGYFKFTQSSLGKAKSCQFCKHVGLTYDIWRCANDWQWVKCSHFRANLDQLPEGFSLDDVPALI